MKINKTLILLIIFVAVSKVAAQDDENEESNGSSQQTIYEEEKQPNEPLDSDPLQDKVNFLINKVNEARTQNGLSELSVDPLLNQIAQEHAQDMVERQFFGHKNPDGESLRQRVQRHRYAGNLGQTIARSLTLTEAFNQLSEGDNFKQILIQPDWDTIGAGIAVDKQQYVYIEVLYSPRNIIDQQLSDEQLENIRGQVISLILGQNEGMKQDQRLSQLIKQWVEGDQQSQLVKYVMKMGNYSSATQSQWWSYEYLNNFIQQFAKEKTLKTPNPKLKKLGVAIVQSQSQINIYAVWA